MLFFLCAVLFKSFCSVLSLLTVRRLCRSISGMWVPTGTCEVWRESPVYPPTLLKLQPFPVLHTQAERKGHTSKAMPILLYSGY